MTQHDAMTEVGTLPSPRDNTHTRERAVTQIVWSLFVLSIVAFSARVLLDGDWEFWNVLAVDELTVLMWVVVTFFSGIILSYSRRYMAGSGASTRFVGRVFAYTIVVMTLVAADSFVLFAAAWLAMGLVMADLIGTLEGWPQARAAARYARWHFIAGSGLLAIALGALWWETGIVAVSELGSGVESASVSLVIGVASVLLLTTMVQSALIPFHGWLLSSMTAPTPASALMHAGFVNAGGILLIRFAPAVSLKTEFMLLIIIIGGASALGGKLLKSVQTDVKAQLGCSTVGQMGFMIMQAGLGFFGAAIAHLILHGFYKAYKFLGSGGRARHTAPTHSPSTASADIVGVIVVVLTGLLGGGVFALLTGKGTSLDSGLLLTVLVVLTVMHAGNEVVQRSYLRADLRYVSLPLTVVPALAVYGLVYRGVGKFLGTLPGVGDPVALTPIHGVVALAFLMTYIAIETGAYRRSSRLYVKLVNVTQAPRSTLLTTTEEYNEY